MININRTYRYIGLVSSKDGTKVSFREEPTRKIKTLAANNLRADYICLPQLMTKIEAIQYALQSPQFSDALDQALFYDSLDYQMRVVEKVTGPKRPRGRPRKNPIEVSVQKINVNTDDVLSIYNEVKLAGVA